MMELETPLYQCHLAAEGKMVPFAGYLLPVQYQGGVIQEHLAVRKKAGLFDVSHMGEICLSGPDALSNINHLFTNDFTNMKEGQVRYSPMCNDSGGVLDDLIVYRLKPEEYFIVVNAANRHKDVEWIKAHLKGDVCFKDISDETAQIALQGPKSFEILNKLISHEQIPAKYYTCLQDISVAGVNCLISQTGYTGEMGYEFYCAPSDAPALWNALLEAGSEFGLTPCGLGSRDTLRLEASMPLYGHEMSETITPLEVGLDFSVKMAKPDFIGKSGIKTQLPLKRKRVGLKLIGRGIAREECPVYLKDVQVGTTTSGTHCPYLGYPAAMALLDIEHTAIGTIIDIEVRGRRIQAEIVSLPFYKREALN